MKIFAKIAILIILVQNVKVCVRPIGRASRGGRCQSSLGRRLREAINSQVDPRKVRLSFKLRRIRTEHKEQSCSLESQLSFGSLCSTRIRSRNGDIVEKPYF